jgi:hypothetical protein
MLTLISIVLPLTGMKLHCAGPTGAIIGLASDQYYNVRLPPDAPANPEKWTLVTHASPPNGQAAVNGSFTGKYMQVLPDDRDSYHSIHGEGSFTMTGLEFVIDIATEGKHSLYLRWTAGDNRGGGDSLYVVMREYATDHIVPGEDTHKPTMVAIDAEQGKFAGCCYEHTTHACPCFATEQDCESWQPTSRASHWGAQCAAGAGQMDNVDDPLWYLFAGQNDATGAATNDMDFNTEPWDATCEAQGTGTRDTGLDFATWTLPVGRYRMVIYPREDGTAVDAFYLAGRNVPPPNGLTLPAGSSTTSGCSTDRLSVKPDGVGRGPTHGANDAGGWGHWTHRGSDYDPSVDAGTGCGHCLSPIAHTDCPSAEVLETMITCDTVQLGQLCEADGECNTNVHINNCEPPPSPPASSPPPGGQGGPRTRAHRGNNDVYKRVPCPQPPAPPSPSPLPASPLFPTETDLSGAEPRASDDPTGTIVLVLLLVLAAALALVAVRKGWARPLAMWVRDMLKGDSDASAYIRNRDSANSSGTAPMSAAAVGPAGASTYNPPS